MFATAFWLCNHVLLQLVSWGVTDDFNPLASQTGFLISIAWGLYSHWDFSNMTMWERIYDNNYLGYKIDTSLAGDVFISHVFGSIPRIDPLHQFTIK